MWTRLDNLRDSRSLPYLVAIGMFLGLLGLAGVPAAVMVFLVATVGSGWLVLHVGKESIREDRALSEHAERKGQPPEPFWS